MPASTSLPNPTGWTVRASTVVRNEALPWNGDTIRTYYTQLLDWANNTNRMLTPVGYSLVNYTDWADAHFWTEFSFTIVPNNGAARDHNEGVLGSSQCSTCSTDVETGSLLCGSCATFQVCNHCMLAGSHLFAVDGQQACIVHSRPCDSCSTARLPENSSYRDCVTCAPRANCAGCRIVFSMGDLAAHRPPNSDTDQLLCTPCHSMVCTVCSQYDRDTREVRTMREGPTGPEALERLCGNCNKEYYNIAAAFLQKWAPSELPVSGSMVIPAMSTRPVRTISIETEFDGSASKVSAALYAASLIANPSRDRYSSRGERSSNYPCILKSDGSVSGGELVTFLVNMDNQQHATALQRMTEVMKGAREQGDAVFSHRAGGHIHIDLAGYSIQDCWNYWTLFQYLNMTLYYLGGSGATYGHRSLKGSDYANPASGGPFGTKRAFTTWVMNQGRSGMHMGNFVGAMRGNCRCGAMGTGEWEECECVLEKATAEWRLWNAEITPRILHGWIAIMQASTAYAQGVVLDEQQFPQHMWSATAFSKLNSGDKSAIWERLTWMFTNLPLTSDERDSIVYTAQKSQLIGFGEDKLQTLLEIIPANMLEKKQPKLKLLRTSNVSVTLAS